MCFNFFSDSEEESDSEDEYENFEQTIFNEYVPTTSEPSPPPTLIYEDQESIVEISPDQALYGSSVEIQLQDGTLVEVLTPPFAGDGWRLRIEGAAIGCRDHFVQLKVQTEDGLRIDEIIMITNSIGRLDHTSIRRWKIKSNFPP